MGKYEDLENLNKLKSSGIISEQEFEDKKKLILAESKNDENKNQEIIKKYSSKAKKDNRKMIIVCSLIIGGAIFLFIILPQIYLSVKSAIEKSNEREIPNIEGMTVEEAKTQLEELDLILESDNNASDAIITYQKDKGKTKKGETVEVYAKTQEQINEEKQKEEEEEKKEEEAKVYSNFNGDINYCKITFDAWWNMMTSENRIIKIKSKEWQVIKQQVSPYANVAVRELYIYPNQEFALIGIFYDDYGNVLSIRFVGISPSMLNENYDENASVEYSYIMLSIPQILKFTTDDNLCKYLQEKIGYCLENGIWYLNERKQGFKFVIGKDEYNNLNVEVCLERYAQD